MNVPQARAALQDLGFTFPKEGRMMNGQLRWGTQAAEKYPTGNPQHKLIGRGVFFAKAVGGFYVTSFIRVQTGPKPHQVRSIGNIFASGKTLAGAIRQFRKNFTTNPKTYNVS